MPPTESNLETNVTLESEKTGVLNEPPFQMLVLGDWSGHAERRPLGARKPIEIDRDNFDDVIKGLGVRVMLEQGLELTFDSLDDFHPDDLYKKIGLFEDLRSIRKRLRNSDTFNSAAREIREWSETPAKDPAPDAEPPADDLLDAILSKPEGGAPAQKGAVSADISRLVSDLVRPHLVAVDEAEQASMVSAVDSAISSLMRSVLHAKPFREIEAAWRGLFSLVRNTDTSTELKIFILDVSKEELLEDLKGDCAVFKAIAAGVNGEPFAAMFGNYRFRPDVEDIAGLIRISKGCAAIAVPFVSHIRPEVLGVPSLADHPDPDDWDLKGSGSEGKLWAAMRDIPEARYLGLTMPRFLARLPYGADTEPVDAFSFEEFDGPHSHDDYLWANSSFLVARLLAETYCECGWHFGDRFAQDVKGLPLHVHKREGETVYQACAEVQLSENAAVKLAEFGLMPIVSFKNLDQIRLVRFRSVSAADPRLKGRWS